MSDATLRALEPDGGNLYRIHPLMVHSGQFWRCRHGVTGYAADWSWIGCEPCRQENPEGARNFGDESQAAPHAP